MIDRMLARLASAGEAELVVVTTSTNPDDAHLLGHARRNGAEAFAGSEADKLQRYLDAARRFDIEFAVIVDGDDLLCSPEHIDAAIRHYAATKADYITQVGLPLGAASYGIRIGALAQIVAQKAENDTEVWGGYFTARASTRVALLEENDPLLRQPGVRMTLDYPEDLAFFRAVYSAFLWDREPTLREVMQILAEHPKIAELNREVQTLYEAKLRSAAPVRFRETSR